MATGRAMVAQEEPQPSYQVVLGVLRREAPDPEARSGARLAKAHPSVAQQRRKARRLAERAVVDENEALADLSRRMSR
jgi:hypothetical protein